MEKISPAAKEALVRIVAAIGKEFDQLNDGEKQAVVAAIRVGIDLGEFLEIAGESDDAKKDQNTGKN